MEIKCFWATLGAGNKTSWHRAKRALGSSATPELIPARRCWLWERSSRRDRGGKEEGKQHLPVPVPGVLRRVSRTLALVKGGGLARLQERRCRGHCPGSLGPGTGQGRASALSVPRVPPREGQSTHLG